MTPWSMILLAYAALYAVFAYSLHADNVQFGYPVVFIVYSALAQSLIAAGIAIHALEKGHSVARIWRWLFPLLLPEPCIGIALDAAIPQDFSFETHGWEWVVNLLLNLWFMAPAYYFNFRVASYRG